MLHCLADGKGGQKIEDTGPLTKKRMETIDDEVTEPRARASSTRHTRTESLSSSGTTRRRCTFAPTCADKHKGKSGQGDYNDVMVAHDENIGAHARQARRARHRRRHDRHVLDRQRPALQQLAGCRHHAVPLREEHQLGRRLARAGLRALAGPDSRRASVLNGIVVPSGLAADASRRRR